MAKEYKNAGIICLILAVIALAGAIIGVLKALPVLIICTLIPAAIYEAYRTEGFFTKILSAGVLVALIAELVIILAKINFSTAKIIDYAGKKAGKYQDALKHLPADKNPLTTKLSFMDMRLAAPVLLVLLSLMLFKRAGGIYTKLLAVLILICSVALVFSIKPELIKLIFG